jgi:hypothetical protein
MISPAIKTIAAYTAIAIHWRTVPLYAPTSPTANQDPEREVVAYLRFQGIRKSRISWYHKRMIDYSL